MLPMDQISRLKHELVQQLDLSASISDDELLQRIEEFIFEHPLLLNCTAREKERSIRQMFHSLRGLDILQPLLDDPYITEIMVNSYEEIFYEKSGEVLIYEGRFESEEKLEDIIQTIVGKVNRIVNESSPIVDARLPDGSRVNVVLPPIALKGPTLTIRKFPERPLSLQDLIERGALTSEAGEFLSQLIKARYNIFIGGGTGSGKTTFLNALTGCIPSDERMITIEDSAELQIQSIPNLVRLETRNRNTEGKGEVAMKDLIRASLRMRPNRIIVGEVRGAEALDMLQAMNTGHDGSLSTGHANSSKDMLSRLETMVLSGANLPLDVIRQQIASAIDILIHISRLRDRSRRVMEICEVAGYKNGQYILNPLFMFIEDKESSGRQHTVAGQLLHTGRSLQSLEKWMMAGFAVDGGVPRSASLSTIGNTE